jgi:hypothetical protein
MSWEKCLTGINTAASCLERPPLEGEIEARPHPCLVGSAASGTEVVGLESSCSILPSAIPLLVCTSLYPHLFLL